LFKTDGTTLSRKRNISLWSGSPKDKHEEERKRFKSFFSHCDSDEISAFIELFGLPIEAKEEELADFLVVPEDNETSSEASQDEKAMSKNSSSASYASSVAMPKKPKTAFYLFSAKRKREFQEEEKNESKRKMSRKSLTSHVTHEWNALSIDQRREYEEKAKNLREIYEKEMQAYNKNHQELKRNIGKRKRDAEDSESGSQVNREDDASDSVSVSVNEKSPDLEETSQHASKNLQDIGHFKPESQDSKETKKDAPQMTNNLPKKVKFINRLQMFMGMSKAN